MKSDTPPCVLLIEDDDWTRDELREALQEEGYKVAAVCHGKEALRWLRKSSKPSVVLLDLMTPVMNGWEFLSFFKTNKTYDAIPVVIVSAFGDHAKVIRGDATHTLNKPIHLPDLLHIIDEQCSAPNPTLH